MKRFLYVILMSAAAQQATAQTVNLGPVTVGAPSVPQYYANGAPMPYPTAGAYASQAAANTLTVPGLPPTSAVPAPIAPLVLPAPYQKRPFMSGDATHAWEAAVGGAVTAFVIYELAKHHHHKHD